MPRLEAILGDITASKLEVVVNAANTNLAAGGGVCGAIFSAAGAGLPEACREVAPCPTGEARITPGFALKAKWIVHAVGPIWRGGDEDEAGLLASAYRESLKLAAAVGACSIAFPAISTGIYGYPLLHATKIAIATCIAAPDAITEIRFICFDESTLSIYEQVLKSF